MHVIRHHLEWLRNPKPHQGDEKYHNVLCVRYHSESRKFMDGKCWDMLQWTLISFYIQMSPLNSVKFRLEFIRQVKELRDNLFLELEDRLHVVHWAEDFCLGPDDEDGEDDWRSHGGEGRTSVRWLLAWLTERLWWVSRHPALCVSCTNTLLAPLSQSSQVSRLTGLKIMIKIRAESINVRVEEESHVHGPCCCRYKW